MHAPPLPIGLSVSAAGITPRACAGLAKSTSESELRVPRTFVKTPQSGFI
jgi:hypothetical protein